MSVSASCNTAVNTESMDNLSIEQMEAIVNAHKIKVTAFLKPLGNELKTKFAECVAISNKIKAVNQHFRAPWETKYTYIVLGWMIKDYLTKHGGSGKGAQIIIAFSPLYTARQIQNVLKNRSLPTSNKYQLWDFDETKDLYTLKYN